MVIISNQISNYGSEISLLYTSLVPAQFSARVGLSRMRLGLYKPFSSSWQRDLVSWPCGWVNSLFTINRRGLSSLLSLLWGSSGLIIIMGHRHIVVDCPSGVDSSERVNLPAPDQFVRCGYKLLGTVCPIRLEWRWWSRATSLRYYSELAWLHHDPADDRIVWVLYDNVTWHGIVI